MRQDEARAAIAEALSLDITLTAKGLNGDCISVGVSCIRKTNDKQVIVREYLVNQEAVGATYITLSLSEAITLALEFAGQRIATEALKQVNKFLNRVNDKVKEKNMS